MISNNNDHALLKFDHELCAIHDVEWDIHAVWIHPKAVPWTIYFVNRDILRWLRSR